MPDLPAPNFSHDLPRNEPSNRGGRLGGAPKSILDLVDQARHIPADAVKFPILELIVEQVNWDLGVRAVQSQGKTRRRPRASAYEWPGTPAPCNCASNTPAGRWVRRLRLWVLALTAAKRLDLNDRLVPVPDRIHGVGEAYHGEPSEKPNDELKGINIEGTEGLS